MHYTSLALHTSMCNAHYTSLALHKSMCNALHKSMCIMFIATSDPNGLPRPVGPYVRFPCGELCDFSLPASWAALLAALRAELLPMLVRFDADAQVVPHVTLRSVPAVRSLHSTSSFVERCARCAMQH